MHPPNRLTLFRNLCPARRQNADNMDLGACGELSDHLSLAGRKQADIGSRNSNIHERALRTKADHKGFKALPISFVRFRLFQAAFCFELGKALGFGFIGDLPRGLKFGLCLGFSFCRLRCFATRLRLRGLCFGG